MGTPSNKETVALLDSEEEAPQPILKEIVVNEVVILPLGFISILCVVLAVWHGQTLNKERSLRSTEAALNTHTNLLASITNEHLLALQLGAGLVLDRGSFDAAVVATNENVANLDTNGVETHAPDVRGTLNRARALVTGPLANLTVLTAYQDATNGLVSVQNELLMDLAIYGDAAVLKANCFASSFIRAARSARVLQSALIGPLNTLRSTQELSWLADNQQQCDDLLRTVAPRALARWNALEADLTAWLRSVEPIRVVAFGNHPPTVPRLREVFAGLDRELAGLNTIRSLLNHEVDVELGRRYARTVTKTVVTIVAVVITLAAFIANSFSAFNRQIALRQQSRIRSKFERLEKDSRAMAKFVTMFQTANSRNADEELGWEMFSHLKQFVSRIRPHISQSYFGDIEIHSGTHGTAKGMLGTDVFSKEQAISQLSLRDLRLDTGGLQVVSGVVMHCSLLPLTQTAAWPRRNTDKQSGFGCELTEGDDHIDLLNTFFSGVETALNGTFGVVHAVTGDSLYALWNVVGNTSQPQLSAVKAAYEIVQFWEGFKERISSTEALTIGIASSGMLAGNMDIGERRDANNASSGVGRRELSIVGPAMMWAERLDSLCGIHKVHIVLDAETVEFLPNLVVMDDGKELAISPIAMLRGINKADLYLESIVYGVGRPRMKADRLKQWRDCFKTIAKVYGKDGNGEVAYKTLEAFAAKEEVGGKAKHSEANDPTITWWRKHLKQAAQQETDKRATQQGAMMM